MTAQTQTSADAIAPTYAAFVTNKLIASGTRDDVLRAAKKYAARASSSILFFEESSGRQLDFDLRGSIDDVLARVRVETRTGPGRPKLGVLSREVSLLPRHWDWLESQPNGASAALRRLVDEARHNETGIERGRHVRNALGRILWAIAGDLENFEEVARSIDSRDDGRLVALMARWPRDVARYVMARIEVASEIEAW